MFAAVVVLILIFNPFRFLSVLSQNLRTSITFVILLIFAAIQLPLNLVSRLTLLAVAVLIIAIAAAKYKQWQYMESVKQSPDVDTVLAHLSYNGFFQAGDEWTKHGCAEIRALLHQAANMECPENLINSVYYAVYCLAWLHGSCYYEKLQEQVDKQQERIAELEASVEDNKYWKNLANEIEADKDHWHEEYETTRQHWFEEINLGHTKSEEIKRLKQENAELLAEIEAHEERESVIMLSSGNSNEGEEESQNLEDSQSENPLDDLPPEQKVPVQFGAEWDNMTRNQKMVAFHDNGISYAKIGDMFGLSKDGAHTAIVRERKRS